MRLGLLGYPIEHSLSPQLYQKLLGERLNSYELFSYPGPRLVPPLAFFAERLDGLNITSPYKKHFFHEVIVPSPIVQKVGALNTLAFKHGKTFGTNTDMLAIGEILKNYANQYGPLQLLLLGDGVMAKLTKLIAEELKFPCKQFSRKQTPDFFSLDLTSYEKKNIQTIVINACSRNFIFKGRLSGSEIFWDYNYSFIPHQSTLPSQVLSYQDGREMLELQAVAAINFWESYL